MFSIRELVGSVSYRGVRVCVSELFGLVLFLIKPENPLQGIPGMCNLASRSAGCLWSLLPFLFKNMVQRGKKKKVEMREILY